MLGERIYTPQQDFFNEVTTLLIGLASFNTATEAFTSFRTTLPHSVDHAPRLMGHVVNASFLVHPLMHTVVRNRWPCELRLAFEAPASFAPEPASTGVQLQSSNITNMVVQLVGTTFLKYYERNVHRPKTAFGTNQKSWPDLWRFAWLLRNAIAHGDRWNITDPKVPATTWHSVTVTPADNGGEWLDPRNFLGGGDVLLLLEELDADSA